VLDGSRKQEALSLKFNFSPHFFLKRFAWGTLCTFVLGVVLSACEASPPSKGSNSEKVYGAVTVGFDKNNSDTGSTEANPDNITVAPPATTLGRLPTDPTRPGYKFVEWNTQKNWKGTRFDENTPLPASVHFIVYAQWEALPQQQQQQQQQQTPPPPSLPRLDVEIVPSGKTLSPLANGTYNELSTTFGVVVSGFENFDDASSVRLEISAKIDETNFVEGLSLPVTSTPTESTKTFSVTLNYNQLIGFADTDGQVSLRLTLLNIQKGYEYAGGAQTLRVAVTDGLAKTRPIPVNATNIQHFNTYARTTAGLARHYRLTENVTLPPGNWTAIGYYISEADNQPFTGSFDGGGKTISNLTIDRSNFQGLFGYINGKNAEIKNLGLENVSISGRDFVGGVVGWNNEGTVQNCYVTGNVTGNGNGRYVGGVVGWNGSNVVGRNNAIVQNCYSTATVNGYHTIGGVVGQNNGGLVQNCYVTGNVSSNDTSLCIVGGVIGFPAQSSILRNCVALNPTLTTRAHNEPPRRVVTSTIGYLSNNYARSNMSLKYNNGSNGIYTPTPGLNSEDGANVSADEYGDSSFWMEKLYIAATGTQSEIFWDFDNVWVWNPTTNLPILRGFDSPQNHTVP